MSENVREKLFAEHPELENFIEENPSAFEALVNLVTYEVTKDFHEEFKGELDGLRKQMDIDPKTTLGENE